MKYIKHLLVILCILALAAGPAAARNVQSGIPVFTPRADGSAAQDGDSLFWSAVLGQWAAGAPAAIAWGSLTGSPSDNADLVTLLGGANMPSPTAFGYGSDLTDFSQAQHTAAMGLITTGINPGHSHIVSAIGTGTGDAIVGSYTPGIAALTDGMRVDVYAPGANTLTNPTFQYNALTAKTIVKGAATALVAGDIPGAGYKCEFSYRAATDTWQLLNPGLTVKNIGTAAGTLAAGNDSRFCYSLTSYGASWNPADGLTYFWGGNFTVAPSTSATYARIGVPIAGTITNVVINFHIGSAGDAEPSSLYLRLNNASDTLLSNAIVCNANNAQYNVTGLSIAVAANDYLEFKWICPTWATTNPTAVKVSATIIVQR